MPYLAIVGVVVILALCFLTLLPEDSYHDYEDELLGGHPGSRRDDGPQGE